MAADPILLVAGTWLGAASGVLAVLTIAGFLSRWGIRFRLVGITSFTALLSLSCLAFAISYNPRVNVPGMFLADTFETGLELSLHDLEGIPRFALSQGFTHTEDRPQLVLDRGQHLLIDEAIVLAKEGPPLAVTENDVGHEQIPQHRRGHFSGEGTVGLKVHVLGPNLDIGSLQFASDRFQGGERRANQHVHLGLPADLDDNFTDQSLRVRRGLVHFPVTSDKFFT